MPEISGGSKQEQGITESRDARNIRNRKHSREQQLSAIAVTEAVARNCKEQQQAGMPKTSGAASNRRKQQQEGTPETSGTVSNSRE
jgi:hypothetical protein